MGCCGSKPPVDTESGQEHRIGPNNRYRVECSVGRGNFGCVRKCFDTETRQLVAIKFIRRGKEMDSVYVEREILNHKMLCHPHVVDFKEVFLTDTDLCIVMNFAEGGTLKAHVKEKGCLREEWARWFFQQLIIAVEYCHKRKVVMRDIKLDNILLDKEQRLIKLCDFGFSKSAVIHTKPNTKLGTPSYLAPEILKSGIYDGTKVDIWTCGVTLYHMLYGGSPIGVTTDPKEIFEKINTNAPIEIPISQQRLGKPPIEISLECRDLLKKLLVKDPKDRISLDGIKNHSWFREAIPEGSLNYNDDLHGQRNLTNQRGLQSDAEIKKLVREAKTVLMKPSPASSGDSWTP